MGIDCSATAAWNALQSELGKRNPISLEAFCSFELLLLVLVTQGKIYISMAFYLVKRVKKKKKIRMCVDVCVNPVEIPFIHLSSVCPSI